MQASALAGALKTPAALVLCLAGILAAFVSLVPAGSFPTGWDPWWNLHVARTWAESGFPAAMPEAGFTQLAHRYAERQLGFVGLLALVGGRDLDPSNVYGLVWIFAILQVLAIFAAMRILAPRSSPWWLVLLPALSATWLFRVAALRDMLAGILFLLLLVPVLARTARARSRHGLWAFLLTAGFGYVHGAVVLPLLLAGFVCLGRYLAAKRWGLGTLVPVLLGIVPPLFLRPDFPHNLELLTTLNVRMPLAALSGALPIQPSEFAPPSLDLLLATSAPFLVALGWLVLLALARRTDLQVAVPAVALGIGAVMGSRLFELAVPFLVVALATSPRPFGPLRPRPWLLALAIVGIIALVVLRQIPVAKRSVAANQLPELAAAGEWLREQGKRGDTVFVTDWGTTSPLAWWTHGSGFVFTGVTDPSLMWAEDPERFAAWWRIKTAADPDPVRTMYERFGARFLVVVNSDAAPGRPLGETAVYLYDALARATAQGWRVVSATFGTRPGWKCYRFDR